ncbi:SDR family oxidoreductase [Larkinella soli]|uniref:SDR family oxidoreductase n=1 Tax=Larkinella soli TaxID=1770527 RepID=UPI000FFC3437|nr:SDR family oxidoreductase [Larkinella soli]
MNLSLTGKTAVVCGSTQGIGRAAAVELALLGANVTLLARNEEKLKEVAGQLDTAQGQKHQYRVADFTRPEEVKAAVESYLKEFPEVHILVNNTGGPPSGPLIDARPEEFLNTFAAHLINNQLLVQAVVPSMKRLGYGRIVNIISTSVKQPITGLGVSNTIRGAVAQWAKTLSLEMARFGITVNNVLPGTTRTARLQTVLDLRMKKEGISAEEAEQRMLREIPAGRFAEPEEVAAAVAFLCTPAAAAINGINVPVDGGKTGSL